MLWRIELVSALHQARLVFGWVTVCRQVNHLGMKPAGYVNLAFYPSWDGKMSISLWHHRLDDDGEYSIAGANLGGSEAQADWLGSMVGGHPVLILHLPNRVNFISADAMMTLL